MNGISALPAECDAGLVLSWALLGVAVVGTRGSDSWLVVGVWGWDSWLIVGVGDGDSWLLVGVGDGDWVLVGDSALLLMLMLIRECL